MRHQTSKYDGEQDARSINAWPSQHPTVAVQDLLYVYMFYYLFYNRLGNYWDYGEIGDMRKNGSAHQHTTDDA
jgi:hypothetical protein